MIKPLNDLEIMFIDQFRSHELFKEISTISWQDFLGILIQRRFLSLSIVNIYELVIDALTDENIKQTVRKILHEEYPRNTGGMPLPSHRELLFQDLLNLGATPTMILTTPETFATGKVREQSYQMMIECLRKPHCQVGLIIFLRFWAEVLVSIEYTCLWRRISERLSNERTSHKARSEFYYFHMIHDSRNSDIGNEKMLGGLTHSQELAVHLKKLIVSEEALAFCVDLTESAYQLKYQFYDQFVNLKHNQE
jgi:hypothetical protein